VKVPVMVVVSCSVPSGSPVTWVTPRKVSVIVPAAPVHGLVSGSLTVSLKWVVVVSA
jgi:hypothetical protein